MVAIRNERSSATPDPDPARRVLADDDVDVETTPTPFGGEMVVHDDEPWDLPEFDDARLARIGEILHDQLGDPAYLQALRDEIRGRGVQPAPGLEATEAATVQSAE